MFIGNGRRNLLVIEEMADVERALDVATFVLFME